jgi:redox-sensing transcriptional repressor
MLSEKTVERLSEYRRHLSDLQARGVTNVFSNTLAGETRVTAAQVRRDMMNLGLSGSTATGYSVADLLNRLGELLDDPLSTRVALIGTGNLGRALLSYFRAKPGKAVIAMAFDSDPERSNRVCCGCRVYPMDELEACLSREGIKTAILCIPAPDAVAVASRLAMAGITGILNFAPAKLKVPDTVFVHNMDITSVIEKVGYYAVRGTRAPGRK